MSMALKSMPPATVTYKLNVCSTIPCSFSISTLYSPSSSCFTFWNPRMICPGPLVQLLHLGSVARSLEHLNHVIVGIGSPTMSRKKKALSPSVAETLSAGFTYFGSFPLAARGVEVLSQSHCGPPSPSPVSRDFFLAGPAPRAMTVTEDSYRSPTTRVPAHSPTSSVVCSHRAV